MIPEPEPEPEDPSTDIRDLYRYVRLVLPFEEVLPKDVRRLLVDSRHREAAFRQKYPAIDLNPGTALVLSWDEIERQHVEIFRADPDRDLALKGFLRIRERAFLWSSEMLLRALLELWRGQAEELADRAARR